MRTVSALITLSICSASFAETPPVYDKAYAESVKTGKPLVVFTGYAETYQLRGSDVVRCHVSRLDGYPSYCVVVAVPEGNTVKWCATLEGGVSEEDVKRAVAEARGVGLKATPKEPSSADADLKLPVGSVEALGLVNARRAARGLRPFIFDAGLTLAAARAAKHRADRLLFGHDNDFQHLPRGCSAAAAGCAAYDAPTVRLFGGWLSCCSEDNYRYAGAAYVVGKDGKMYMHLFVR